jgi:hypothetical protein
MPNRSLHFEQDHGVGALPQPAKKPGAFRVPTASQIGVVFPPVQRRAESLDRPHGARYNSGGTGRRGFGRLFNSNGGYFMAKLGSILQMACAIALGSAALLVGPSGAQAGAGGFAVSGSASAKDQKLVQGAATYAAGETGWVMMKTPLDEAALKKVQTCLKAGDNPWPCIEPTASKVGFDRLILLQADADKANPGTIVITTQVVAAQVGGMLVDRAFCEKCTATTLEEQTQSLATRQIRALMAQKGDTKIEVVSTPSSAVVKIDGAMVGETDATFRTYPGKHTVMVARAGYTNAVQDVTVAEGKTERIDVVLQSEGGKPLDKPADKPNDKPVGVGPHGNEGHDGHEGHAHDDGRIHSKTIVAPKPAPGRSKLVPGLLIGGGAAGVVLGGVLVFAQADAPAKGSSQPEKLFGSTPIGIGVGLAGAAALGVGVYLWTRHDAQATSGPIAMPTTTGGVVGWAGNF